MIFKAIWMWIKGTLGLIMVRISLQETTYVQRAVMWEEDKIAQVEDIFTQTQDIVHSDVDFVDIA